MLVEVFYCLRGAAALVSPLQPVTDPDKPDFQSYFYTLSRTHAFPERLKTRRRLASRLAAFPCPQETYLDCYQSDIQLQNIQYLQNYNIVMSAVTASVFSRCGSDTFSQI